VVNNHLLALGTQGGSPSRCGMAMRAFISMILS